MLRTFAAYTLGSDDDEVTYLRSVHFVIGDRLPRVVVQGETGAGEPVEQVFLEAFAVGGFRPIDTGRGVFAFSGA